MGAVSDHEAEDDSDAEDGGATPVPGRQEARSAALDAVEPERLLEGEDEHTAYVDDAVHWTKVYAELLDFKQSLLDLAERRAAGTQRRRGNGSQGDGPQGAGGRGRAL